ncbi:MAG: signal recognition particle-docking protein FtsY [Candidatus ainarchaeum sp.]|nr:signal recognition particle-docking protein FtsY [Candidatus ainarchaeum sp.]MDD5096329.1 signal recognition particle-docking protein FtsY [Candidatus ainarchaeum sp.]
MFDLLKRSISGFVGKITGRKEKEEPAKGPEPVFEGREAPEIKEGRKPAPVILEKAEKPKSVEKPEPAVAAEKQKHEKKPVAREVPKPTAVVETKKTAPEKVEKAREGPKPPVVEKPPEQRRKPDLEVGQVAVKETEKLEKKVRKGIFEAVRETVSGTAEIREGEIGELLEELELGLLESDVALEVADSIKEELKRRVVGAKVPKGKTAEFIREQLRGVLVSLVKSPKAFSIIERVRGLPKPVKMMVLGPNGAGKTTTIAKITKMLQDAGFTVAIAAADTFRAAAAEQLIHHGDKLGVKVISGAYGSDPTALAFDAVEYAKAHKIDVVLIDTAGRQDTNINLINQLRKMNRVIAPDMKIYVGESIAGNAIAEQARAFNKEIGLDGVVLTKLDCDPKGGTVVSITKMTGVPIIYVGTGQGYSDIEMFDAEKIIGEILS